MIPSKLLYCPCLIDNSLPAINWLKQRTMLKNEVKCSSCDKEMNWTKYAKSNDGKWKWQTKDCPKYKSTAPILLDRFCTTLN